ncbi:MAG: hypothetical protein LBT52_06365 [Clostridiales Family XIII bacterium]|jgi:4-hydroxy-tetrahydrodipicolinate reductase|nr:hypothetical protein [Clostridiales Family XIII bacterium]
MSGKEITAIIIGVGEMGRIAVRALCERGVKLVGAVDINEALIGKDVGEVARIPAVGIAIEKDLASLFERVKPQIAFASFASEISAIEPDFTCCAEHGVNVVTISMDALSPFSVDTKTAERIDAKFKENGVSMLASGIQDAFWSEIGLAAAGACNRVESITLSNVLPLNGMGSVVAEEFCVNMTPAAFESAMKGIDPAKNPSVSGPLLTLYENCRKMGLHPAETKITIEPTLADREIPVPEWDMVIKIGNLTGQSFNADVYTEEGLVFYSKMVIKLLGEGEEPGTDWIVSGEPELHISLHDIHGEITTAASAVNRIPDVIAAPPGIVTIADLSYLLYRPNAWAWK